jgi:uncharacterized protein YydD (DUF2326 family)
VFLRSLGSSDPRFKTVHFRSGLNLLVAERTDYSQQGDSRNGTGKSSFIRILRFLLGGQLANELRASELRGHTFTATLELPSADSSVKDVVLVSRAVSATTRVGVSGWSATQGRTDIHVDEWRTLLAARVFGAPETVARPTSPQLWGQLVRTDFSSPVKTYPVEAEWEAGARLGYLLGLAPEILGKAGDVSQLTRQRKAIREAVQEGAIGHLTLDEAGLRSQLASARTQRDRVRESLAGYRVNAQYASHQKDADGLSARIQDLNDEALALDRRAREIGRALENEVEPAADPELARKVARVYSEVRLVLPETVGRRFEEVTEFHASVVRNRRSFLEEEQRSVQARLGAVVSERASLDEKRRDVMRLLGSSVALDTFLEGQRSLADLEAQVADLERRLDSAASINKIDTTLKMLTAETVAAMHNEIEERAASLELPISLFHELGGEIYSDRQANLLISPAAKGALKVDPEIDGDASDGIRGVATFLLDTVCLLSAMKFGRAPGLLVHDSHLFDAVDHRQVASCLSIGARLSEEAGFQYIVTMNSDSLTSVESEGAFDRSPYTVEAGLTDATEGGGLFGFRYD